MTSPMSSRNLISSLRKRRWTSLCQLSISKVAPAQSHYWTTLAKMEALVDHLSQTRAPRTVTRCPKKKRTQVWKLSSSQLISRNRAAVLSCRPRSAESASVRKRRTTFWFALASVPAPWVQSMSSVWRSGSTRRDWSMKARRSLRTFGRHSSVNFARSHSRTRCGRVCSRLCSLRSLTRITWFWKVSKVHLPKLSTFSICSTMSSKLGALLKLIWKSPTSLCQGPIRSSRSRTTSCTWKTTAVNSEHCARYSDQSTYFAPRQNIHPPSSKLVGLWST